MWVMRVLMKHVPDCCSAKGTMIGCWRYALFVFVAFCPGLSSSYLEYYGGEDMCGKTIVLGYQTFGVNFRFYASNDRDPNYSCSTTMKIKHPFVSALKFQSSYRERDCKMRMRLEYDTGSREYSFCDFPKDEIELARSYVVTLNFINTGRLKWYSFVSLRFIIYAYLTTSSICDDSSTRCMNGRCVNDDLFCDEDFNFCTDNTIRNCNTDLTKDDTSSGGFVSNAAPIGLIASSCIVFVMVISCCCCWLCCKNRDTSRNQANDGRPSPTSPDVFTIPTSQDNPDETNYVIDYRKVEEPPSYESLELSALSTNHSARAHANGDADCHLRQTERSAPSTVLSGATNYFPERDEARVIDNTDHESGAATAGVRNERFEDELPSYEEVLSDEGRFNV